MKNRPLKSNHFSVRNIPDSICPKPQPDEMIELDLIEVVPKSVKWSGESKMSEEVRFSKQSKTSKKSLGLNLLSRSTKFSNDALKFVSIVSSGGSHKLFKHKCRHIQDEYLTCECNKYLREICNQPECSKNCVSFKFHNNPQLYETVRDSLSSANTASAMSESLGGSTGYCEMPIAKPEIKLHKESVCKCQAGGCRNQKCPCKKIGEFCDITECDCRQCQNYLLFESNFETPSQINEMEQQKSDEEQRSEIPTIIMEEENSAEFEEMNFFIHLKSSRMEMEN